MTEREEQAVVVLNTLHDNPLLSDIHRQALEVGIMAIKALSRSENPNTCGDAISRQAVLDAFWKLNVELSPTAIWTIQNMVKDVPSVTPQPCEDAISRHAVLDIITFEDKWLFDAKSHNKDTEIAFSSMKSKISEMPSVTPQQRTGRWIMPVQDDGMSDPIYYQVRCSECGFDLDPQTWHMELHQYGADKYCPNCGAKMEVEE